MSDTDIFDPFNGVTFPKPMSPLRTAPQVNSTMPPPPAPQQGYQPGQDQEVGGLINFFKGLFHRQSDLDKIMDENGLRQPAQPGGVRG